MSGLHEGTGGVVDQHGVGRIAGEGGQSRLHRVRPLGAPADHTDDVYPSQDFGRRRFLALGDHHDQQLGAGRGKRLDGPAKDRLAGEQPPLLGTHSARAASHSSGGDDGCEAHRACFGEAPVFVQGWTNASQDA